MIEPLYSSLSWVHFFIAPRDVRLLFSGRASRRQLQIVTGRGLRSEDRTTDTNFQVRDRHLFCYMKKHIIIDLGHTTIIDNGGRGGIVKVEPGCALCGAKTIICEMYPNCPGKAYYSIAKHDQKANQRKRKLKSKSKH